MNKEDEFIELVRIMIDVGEAAAGTPLTGDRRLVDAEGLSQKFFQHAVSAFYLSRGPFIPEVDVQCPGRVSWQRAYERSTLAVTSCHTDRSANL